MLVKLTGRQRTNVLFHSMEKLGRQEKFQSSEIQVINLPSPAPLLAVSRTILFKSSVLIANSDLPSAKGP